MYKKEPCKKPFIGCPICGCGEMKADENTGIITVSLDTELYNCFGGWSILKDGETFFTPEYDANFMTENEKPLKTLREFEEIAKNDPEHDWRAWLDLPLRSATYQRQGEDTWILIDSGIGFA